MAKQVFLTKLKFVVWLFDEVETGESRVALVSSTCDADSSYICKRAENW